MDYFLGKDDDALLLDPDKVDGRDCYRVRIVRRNGSEVLSIDQETYVLRRLALPTDGLRQAMVREHPVDKLSLVADFVGASLNGKIDPPAFQFQVPAGAETVDLLIPLQTPQLLGQRAPDFKFADLDGKPVTPQTLGGRPAVLVFWTCVDGSRFDKCIEMLRNVEKAGGLLKSTPPPVFCAVCADSPKIKNSDLAKAMEAADIHLPVLRVPDEAAIGAFRLNDYPTLVILGANGTVQYCEVEDNPRLADVLPAKLAKVLAGEDIYQEGRKAFAEKVERMRSVVREQNALDNLPPENTPAPVPEARPNPRTTVQEVPIPSAKTAPASVPQRLKLTALWKCTVLKSPGNILVAPPGPTGAAGGDGGRLLVVENARSIAEVGLDGKVVAIHPLDLAPGEYIGHLRAARGADGKRHLAAFLWMQQRCHVLDENWKIVCHYPENALQNRHSGITDVELGDLAGDGRTKLLVSYASVVGVQQASLDGHFIWSNRQVYNISRLAIAPADRKGCRDLFCVDGTNAIHVLDARGELLQDLSPPGIGALRTIFVAPMSVGGGTERPAPWCCGISARHDRESRGGICARRFGAAWSHLLPAGFQPQPIEPIVAGQIGHEGRGVWLLPGPDGSIHILTPDGRLVDRFNYGAPLQGLATVEIDGRSALVVATAAGLEALRVD